MARSTRRVLWREGAARRVSLRVRPSSAKKCAGAGCSGIKYHLSLSLLRLIRRTGIPRVQENRAFRNRTEFDPCVFFKRPAASHYRVLEGAAVSDDRGTPVGFNRSTSSAAQFTQCRVIRQAARGSYLTPQQVLQQEYLTYQKTHPPRTLQ